MATSVAFHDSAENETVSEAVISQVAEQTGTDPLSLEPLYNVVDPDALNRLFEPGRENNAATTGSISFTYCGCHVEITEDSDVHVSSVE